MLRLCFVFTRNGSDNPSFKAFKVLAKVYTRAFRYVSPFEMPLPKHRLSMFLCLPCCVGGRIVSDIAIYDKFSI